MKSTSLALLFSLWLLSATISLASRPDPSYTLHVDQQTIDPATMLQGMAQGGGADPATMLPGMPQGGGAALPGMDAGGLPVMGDGGGGGSLPGMGGGSVPGMPGGAGADPAALLQSMTQQMGAAPGGSGFGLPGMGAMMNSMTCTQPGPCYNKKLTCPENCYKSYSGSKNGYGYGGGSGGCTMDCTDKCTATCTS